MEDHARKIKLNVLESNCDCMECSRMCHSPCCGTPEEIEKLIEHGYAKQLMLDDYPDANTLIKPALKGFGGKKAPYETSSTRGCVFWKKGKCKLHNLGLKPFIGRYAHHANTIEQVNEVGAYVDKSWEPSEKVDRVINLWKSKTGVL